MADKNYSVFTKNQESFLDLRIYQFGREKCAPLHLYGPAKRNHYLFHYILDGEGILQFTNSQDKVENVKVHKGEGFLVFPGRITTYFADALDPWEYAWIEFDGIQSKEFASKLGLSFDSSVYRPKSSASINTIKKNILNFNSLSEQSDYQIIGKLYLAFDELVKHSPYEPKPQTNKIKNVYSKRVMEYIYTNYSEPIHIDEIAQECGLNKSYLGRIFKAETGISMQQFIIDYRLTSACELLKNTDLLVKSIAQEVGYTDPLNFSRMFKVKYGVSPNKWRVNDCKK